MSTQVTPLRIEVLKFIDSAIKAQGWAPTVRELMEKFGWTSTHSASGHIDRLVKLELVNRGARSARALAVTPKGRALLRGSR